jgi:polyferredoxin
MNYALYTVIALQVVDIVSTYWCLTSGKGIEGNKFLVKLFEKTGLLTGLILIKSLLVVWLVLVYPWLPIEVLYILIVGYLWVGYNNIMIIIKN